MEHLLGQALVATIFPELLLLFLTEVFHLDPLSNLLEVIPDRVIAPSRPTHMLEAREVLPNRMHSNLARITTAITRRVNLGGLFLPLRLPAQDTVAAKCLFSLPQLLKTHTDLAAAATEQAGLPRAQEDR